MLEPPDISTRTLVERILTAYGLPVVDATFLPEGNDSSAWAFRLDGDGAWFLKVLGRRVNPGTLAVPSFLAQHGVRHLVAPLSTADGRLADHGDPFTFVVYPFFDGQPGGKLGPLPGVLRTQLGCLLRRIHDTPADENLAARMWSERFHVRDSTYIDGALTSMPTWRPTDPLAAAFKEFWMDHEQTIIHALARTHELASIATASHHEVVICHADFHAWNVLVATDGDFVVVDWDETVIAPRERDLMFVSGNIADLDPEATDFFAGYGDVDVNLELLAYYRYDWVLQEVADYHRRVSDGARNEPTRRHALELFMGLFDPDDVVDAAHDADARIRTT
jgi:spectinomycin phosphotransferase